MGTTSKAASESVLPDWNLSKVRSVFLRSKGWHFIVYKQLLILIRHQRALTYTIFKSGGRYKMSSQSEFLAGQQRVVPYSRVQKTVHIEGAAIRSWTQFEVAGLESCPNLKHGSFSFFKSAWSSFWKSAKVEVAFPAG